MEQEVIERTSPLMCCVGWGRGDWNAEKVQVGKLIKADLRFGQVAGEPLPAVAQSEPVVP